MVARGEHGSTLSALRAFVVHLGAAGRPGRRRFRGQVEHLASGESVRFSSVKQLLAFFDATTTASVERRASAKRSE
jgi:hypothetical protein